MSDALPWFPLVGCVLGAILYGLARAGSLLLGDWPEGLAALVLAGSVLLTRGFHLDGLADWADGFGGGRDRAQTLAIMKDSKVGVFGMVALILVLLTKWVAFARLVDVGSLHWIVSACIVSRTTMVQLAVRLPYCRPEGGTARPFVNEARFCHLAWALLLSLLLLLLISGPAGVVVLIGGLIGCRFLRLWFHRRIGGVTGDLLGASSEIIETGLLFTCATTGQWLAEFTSWRTLLI
jgi:adenosylcobinamide-GDP ribazoletransferase